MELGFYLTHQSNQSCGYDRQGRRFDRFMSPETLSDGLVHLFSSPGTDHKVDFDGGEPLLMSTTIEETVRECNHLARASRKNVTYHIDTNGILLDRRHVGILRDAGFSVNVWLDGRGWPHDANRRSLDGNQGTWAAVHDNIRYAVHELPGLSTTTTIHPKNVAALPRTFLYLVDLGIRHMDMRIDFEADWTDSDRTAFECSLDKLATRYLAARQAGIDLAFPLFERGFIARLFPGARETGCSTVARPDVVLTPKNRFYLCRNLVGEDLEETHSVGDIDGGISAKKVAMLQRSTAASHKKCHSCPAFATCSIHECLCRLVHHTALDPQKARSACRLELVKAGVIDRLLDQLDDSSFSLLPDRLHGYRKAITA